MDGLFDMGAFYEAAVETKRRRKQSWEAVAMETGLSVGQFDRLKHGRLPTVPHLVKLLLWMRRPLEDFLTGSGSLYNQGGQEVIIQLIRQDDLLPEGSRHIVETLVRAEYDRVGA